MSKITTVEVPADEELVPLRRAARLVPLAGDRRVHPSTLCRWAQRGVRVGDRVVRLGVVRLGGRIYTSRGAIERFAAACAAAAAADEPAPPPRASRARSRRVLDAAGIRD